MGTSTARRPAGTVASTGGLPDLAHGNRFDELSTCIECVAAGYGWSIRKQRCGGYKNRLCAPSMPDHATDGGVPAPGPWILGHSFEDAGQKTTSTEPGCWLCGIDSQTDVTALVLGLVMAIAFSWWAVKPLYQNQVRVSGLRDTLDSSNQACRQDATVELESLATVRGVVNRRQRRGRAGPQGLFQRPVMARGILLNGSNRQSATRERNETSSGLRFDPKPEVRFFKRWQKPPTIKQSSPRKAQGAAFELTGPFGSLAQTLDGSCLTDQPSDDGVKDRTDMSYIFGGPS